MSDWLKQLQQAEYRGVPFQVDSVDFTVGNDGVLREYPFQDLPTWQSVGAASDEMRFPAYVIGDDYLEQRNKLIEKLSGPGVLVHPTRGRIHVEVKGKVQVKENPVREGGMARLDITFVHAAPRRYPKASADTQSQLRDKAAKADAAAQADFAEQFDIENKPGWLQEKGKNLFRKGADLIEGVMGAYRGEAAGGRADLFSLVSDPLALAESVADLMALPDLIESDFNSLLTSFDTLFNPLLTGGNDGFESPYNTPSRQQEKANTQAAEQLVATLATIRVAEVASETTYTSQQQAQEVSVTLDQQFQHLLKQPRSAESFQALVDLHAATLADIAARSVQAVRMTTYTPNSNEPLIYISYKLYGTAQFADELMENNPQILHPLLVPAGQQLKVVARD